MKVAVALAAIFVCGSVLSQPTPAGTQGVHWDQKMIEIKNDAHVVLTGQVTTTNTKPGNTSSVVMYVDGVEVGRRGGERAQWTLPVNYSTNGAHLVRVQCYNERADAESCVVNVTRADSTLVFDGSK